MNTGLLTDLQLNTLSRNQSLNKSFRKDINAELKRRNLAIPSKPVASGRKLPKRYKVVLILFPCFISILLSLEMLILIMKGRLAPHQVKRLFILITFNAAIIYRTNKFLVAGEKRKWKEFWSFLYLGLTMWIVIVILLARFFLLH